MEKLKDKDLNLLMNRKPFLTTRQMAEMFGYKSTDALRKQRMKGKKPLFPFFKIGRRVFYDLGKILELIEQKLKNEK
jgi:hypothetical protein